MIFQYRFRNIDYLIFLDNPTVRRFLPILIQFQIDLRIEQFFRIRDILHFICDQFSKNFAKIKLKLPSIHKILPLICPLIELVNYWSLIDHYLRHRLTIYRPIISWPWLSNDPSITERVGHAYYYYSKQKIKWNETNDKNFLFLSLSFLW